MANKNELITRGTSIPTWAWDAVEEDITHLGKRGGIQAVVLAALYLYAECPVNERIKLATTARMLEFEQVQQFASSQPLVEVIQLLDQVGVHQALETLAALAETQNEMRQEEMHDDNRGNGGSSRSKGQNTSGKPSKRVS